MTWTRLSTRVWAWAIVIIVLTITGGGVGLVVSRDIEPSYVATASLLVGDLDRPDLSKPDFQASAMVTAIYGGLIRSESVLGEVVDRLDLPTDWQELKDRVHVDLGMNESPIIFITVYAHSSAEATSTTRAITDRMLDLSRPGMGGLPSTVLPRASDGVSQIEQVMSRADERLSGLEAKASSSQSASKRARLQRRIDRESSVLMTWQDVYGASLSATTAAANDLHILQGAEARGGRLRPHVAINMGLGASIGCLLAITIGVAIRRVSSGKPRRFQNYPKTGRSEIAAHGTLESSANSSTLKDPWARELTHPPADEP